jgi:dsRNA-specific ribonuclease
LRRALIVNNKVLANIAKDMCIGKYLLFGVGEKKQDGWHSPVMPIEGRLAVFENPGLGMEYDDDIWKKENIYWSSENG